MEEYYSNIYSEKDFSGKFKCNISRAAKGEAQRVVSHPVRCRKELAELRVEQYFSYI